MPSNHTTDTLLGLEIEVYKPKARAGPVGHEDTPSFTLSETDLAYPSGVTLAEWESQVGRRTPSGQLTLANDDFRFTEIGTDTPIDAFDKLVIYSDADTGGYGDGPYGDGPYGGWWHEGSFLVEDVHTEWTSAGQCVITLDITDYVFGCLGTGRVHYTTPSERPLAGASNAILNEILDYRFPWLNQSRISDTFSSILTDYFVDGKTGAKVVDEIANVAAVNGIDTVLSSTRDRVIFEPLEDVTPVQTSDGSTTWDLPKHFAGTLDASTNSKEMVNQMRFSGGVAPRLDDEQTDTSGGVVQVSDTNRLMVKVQNRKTELIRIDLNISGDGSSDDGLRVRLQADKGDGTGPVAPDDVDSDLISHTQKEALDLDGWRPFRVGQHSIPRQPWLIIDSPGSDGYGVKVASDGTTPAYRVFFPKPIVASEPDQVSQAEYLRVDGTLENEAIVTEEAAHDRAKSEMHSRGTTPSMTFGPLKTDSPDAYSLRPGDVVIFDEPQVRVTGDWLVSKRSVTYEGTRIKSEVEFSSPNYDT